MGKSPYKYNSILRNFDNGLLYTFLCNECVKSPTRQLFESKFQDLDLLDELLSLGLSPVDLQKKIDMILQDPKTSIKEGHEDLIFSNEALLMFQNLCKCVSENPVENLDPQNIFTENKILG